jgi:formylglycine-generating enzyme required for sulfatase activity
MRRSSIVHCALSALAAAVAACSGDAFHYVESDRLGAVADGGAGFPPLRTDSTAPDQTAASAGAGGTGGAEPDAGPVEEEAPPTSTQPATPCGVVRSADPELADDEVCVRAGTFDMGSAAAPSSGYFAQGPVHAVTLSAFFLDAFEVTVSRYRRCVDAGVCAAPSTTAAQGCTYTSAAADHEQYPITCAPWTSARDFCDWDGGRSLPTEAQWEQAARNPSGSKYPWGDAFSCDRAVLAGASQCTQYSGTLPQPVGSARAGASPERVFDLIGNAAEWVADWFGTYPSGAVSNPTGPATGSSRVQRGGSWLTLAADATSYGRRGESPAAIGPYSFRCARPAE